MLEGLRLAVENNWFRVVNASTLGNETFPNVVLMREAAIAKDAKIFECDCVVAVCMDREYPYHETMVDVALAVAANKRVFIVNPWHKGHLFKIPTEAEVSKNVMYWHPNCRHFVNVGSLIHHILLNK